jgi:hypothetical protein
VGQSNALFEELDVGALGGVLLFVRAFGFGCIEKLIEIDALRTSGPSLGGSVGIDFFIFFRTNVKKFLCPFLQGFQILSTHE